MKIIGKFINMLSAGQKRCEYARIIPSERPHFVIKRWRFVAKWKMVKYVLCAENWFVINYRSHKCLKCSIYTRKCLSWQNYLELNDEPNIFIRLRTNASNFTMSLTASVVTCASKAIYCNITSVITLGLSLSVVTSCYLLFIV